MVALLVLAPVLFWNSQHDWVSIRHQLGKAAPNGAGFFGLHSLEFTIGYLLIFSLVGILWGLSVMPQAARREGRKDGPFTLILLVSLTPLAFFTVALLHGSFADPKWANVAFLGLYILLGKVAADLWRAGQGRRVVRVLTAAHVLNGALIALVLWHVFRPILPIPADKDPTRQLMGWRETVQDAEALIRSKNLPLPSYVVSAYYPLASEFALHLSNQPLTHSVERPGRNLWSPLDRLNESNTVIVCERSCERHIARIHKRTGLTMEYLGHAGAPAWGVSRHEADLYRVTGRTPGWTPPLEPGPEDPSESGPGPRATPRTQ
jgi:hypothetical protein